LTVKSIMAPSPSYVPETPLPTFTNGDGIFTSVWKWTCCGRLCPTLTRLGGWQARRWVSRFAGVLSKTAAFYKVNKWLITIYKVKYKVFLRLFGVNFSFIFSANHLSSCNWEFYQDMHKVKLTLERPLLDHKVQSWEHASSKWVSQLTDQLQTYKWNKTITSQS